MRRRPRCVRRVEALPRVESSAPPRPSSLGPWFGPLAAALVACKAPAAPADSTPGAASPAPSTNASDAETAPGPGDRVKSDGASAEAKPEAPTRTAVSGLDPGMKLRPFDATDVTSDERYCPVCRFADAPTIVLVGAVDDPEFHQDLADVEAVLARHRPFGNRPDDDPVEVFALVGAFGDDGLTVPPGEREAIFDAAAQIRRRLGLHMPVLVPEFDDETAPASAFEYYGFRRGRTLMLADDTNVVLWSAVAPPHLAEFDAALAPLMKAE